MKKLIDKIKADEECKFLSAMLAIALLIALIMFFSATASAAELDITEPCGLEAEELEELLKHDLTGYADEFLQAEEDYGINALFLVSIAAHESGWGRYQFRENNIFGYGKKDFESVEECIDFVANAIKTDYISETGKYYNGATVEGIAKNYCNSEWAGYTKGIWEGLRTKSTKNASERQDGKR